MPFLPGYRNDVFVSYSLENEKLPLDGKPWVQQFRSQLELHLMNRLPRNAKQLKIGYAGLDLRNGNKISSCEDEVRNSAILLIIGSARYLDPWPQRELQAYLERAPEHRHIFVAELLPLPEGDGYGTVLEDQFRTEFWTRTERGSPRTYSESSGHFQNLLADFARDVADTLGRIDNSRDGPPEPPPGPDPGNKTVLLAQVTEDLDSKAHGLRSYLSQYRVRVIPERGFPQGGADFTAAFTEAAKQADIIVQLLSSVAGRRPPDLPEGYAKEQERIAAASGKEFLRWCPLELKPESVEDPVHRELVAGSKAMLFEQFKEMVKDRATAPPPVALADSSVFIFVNADEVDAGKARAVMAEIRRRQGAGTMPVFGQDSMKDWVAKYKQSGKIVLLHENSSPDWLDAQMRLCLNTISGQKKKGQPRTCVVYLGPPPKDEDGLTVTHPLFDLVTDPEGRLTPLYDKIF